MLLELAIWTLTLAAALFVGRHSRAVETQTRALVAAVRNNVARLSDRALGVAALGVVVVALLYYTIWIVIAPFLPRSNPVRASLLPASSTAGLLVPALILTTVTATVVAFVAFVMIRDGDVFDAGGGDGAAAGSPTATTATTTASSAKESSVGIKAAVSTPLPPPVPLKTKQKEALKLQSSEVSPAEQSPKVAAKRRKNKKQRKKK
jgi:hypothetical protein